MQSTLYRSDSCLPDPDRPRKVDNDRDLPQGLGAIPDRPQLLVAIPDRPRKLGAIPDRPQKMGAIPDRHQRSGTDHDRLYGQYDKVSLAQQPPLFSGRHTFVGIRGNRLLVIRTVLIRTLKSLR